MKRYTSTTYISGRILYFLLYYIYFIVLVKLLVALQIKACEYQTYEDLQKYDSFL